MKNIGTTAAVLAIVGTLGLSGCGGDAGNAPTAAASATPTTTATTSPTPEETVDWDNAVDFTTAALGGDFETARALTARDSPAERYLEHQEAMQEAYAAAGQAMPPSDPTVTVDKETGVVTGTVDDQDYEWSDWQFDGDGRIVTWTTDSGPLADRLWTESPSDKIKGNSVKVVSAYESSFGDLWVVLDVTAATTIVPDYSATLTDTDKRQRQTTGAVAPEEIEKGTSAYVVLVFEDADFGGTLKYEILTDDYDSLGSVKLKIS